MVFFFFFFVAPRLPRLLPSEDSFSSFNPVARRVAPTKRSPFPSTNESLSPSTTTAHRLADKTPPTPLLALPGPLGAAGPKTRRPTNQLAQLLQTGPDPSTRPPGLPDSDQRFLWPACVVPASAVPIRARALDGSARASQTSCWSSQRLLAVAAHSSAAHSRSLQCRSRRQPEAAANRHPSSQTLALLHSHTHPPSPFISSVSSTGEATLATVDR